MPALDAYDRESNLSYALGLFPAMELMKNRPADARRLLLSEKAESSEGARALRELCDKNNVRAEIADKVLRRISGKDNCFAAVAFEKRPGDLSDGARHLCLHHPSDMGNLGTILRTALGFGYTDIAIIRPCADPWHPHVIRSSMGAVFSLNIREYDDFAAYRAAFPARALYPFMLCGECSPDAAAKAARPPFTLIMGNEGAGLPDEFASLGVPVRIPHSDRIDSLNLAVAAAIGMYEFGAYK